MGNQMCIPSLFDDDEDSEDEDDAPKRRNNRAPRCKGSRDLTTNATQFGESVARKRHKDRPQDRRTVEDYLGRCCRGII